MNINSRGQQILMSSCEKDEDRWITKNSCKGNWIGCACQIQDKISIMTKYQELNCCWKHDYFSDMQ